MGSKPMSLKVKVTDEEVMGWIKRLLITDEDLYSFEIVETK